MATNMVIKLPPVKRLGCNGYHHKATLEVSRGAIKLFTGTKGERYPLIEVLGTPSELAAMAKALFEAIEFYDREEKTAKRFTLRADDVPVWSGDEFPTQRQIDRSANAANLRGWNGTQLDVYIDGEWSESVNPSEEVLS